MEIFDKKEVFMRVKKKIFFWLIKEGPFDG